MRVAKRWPVTHDDVSLFWCGLNKSKRSVALDLGKPEGREIARGLVAYDAADAVRIAGLRSNEIAGVLGYEGRAAMIHRDDLVVTQSASRMETQD